MGQGRLATCVLGFHLQRKGCFRKKKRGIWGVFAFQKEIDVFNYKTIREYTLEKKQT